MSWEATTRVLSVQVGDARRKLVLQGYANHAHPDGTSAYAKPATIAKYAECSRRTVQRHVNRLITDGFMREGDQRIVEHFPADRRPIVYDISMSDADRDAWRRVAQQANPDSRRAAAAANGRKGPPKRGVTDCHPDGSDAGGDKLSRRGVTDSHAGGDTQVSPEASNNPVKPTTTAGAVPAAATPEAGSVPAVAGSIRTLADQVIDAVPDATQDEANAAIAILMSRQRRAVVNPGGLVATVKRAGGLAALVEEARETMRRLAAGADAAAQRAANRCGHGLSLAPMPGTDEPWCQECRKADRSTADGRRAGIEAANAALAKAAAGAVVST